MEKSVRGASLIKRIKIGGKARKKKYPLYFFNNFRIIFVFVFPFYHKVFDFDGAGGGGFGGWGAHYRRNCKCSISLFRKENLNRTISN